MWLIGYLGRAEKKKKKDLVDLKSGVKFKIQIAELLQNTNQRPHSWGHCS